MIINSSGGGKCAYLCRIWKGKLTRGGEFKEVSDGFLCRLDGGVYA